MRARALLVTLAITLLAGCGGGGHTTSTSTSTAAKPKPTAKPILPGYLSAPSSSCTHVMGGCLPHPKPGASLTHRAPPNSLFASGRIVGPDFSNNDAVSDRGSWQAIARQNRFVYDKSIEGVGFTDSTAAMMAALAHAFGLPAGGYDFLHVCLNDAASEARHFVIAARAQHLLGPGALPLSGDAEFPFGGLACNGAQWVGTWVATIYALDGHVCPIMYTGAWWWNPHLGSYWPTCAGAPLKSWISGYGVPFPFMPSGMHHLDIWQFTDKGANGASFADLNAWQDGEAAFVAWARATPPVDPYAKYPKPVRIFHVSGGIVRASEYKTVKTWDGAYCAQPARRRVCVTSSDHMRLLLARINFLAFHVPGAHGWRTLTKPRWGSNELGARAAGIRGRLP